MLLLCHKCKKEIRCAIHLCKTFIKQKFNELYISNQVLKQIDVDLFKNLNEHAHDQTSIENDIVHLIRAIIQKYIKIRLHYIALNSIDKSNSKRQLYNKLVLYKGQTKNSNKINPRKIGLYTLFLPFIKNFLFDIIFRTI